MMQDLKLFEPRFQRLVVGLKEYEVGQIRLCANTCADKASGSLV